MRSSTTLRVIAATICAITLALLHPAPSGAISSSIVISQVYGGGGNTGAPFNSDFIELFNRGEASVSIAGWSLQYASATGTGNFGTSATQLTELPSVTIGPGQYFLIQEASGATGAALPTPDFIDATAINMSGTGGKVALVSNAVTLGCNGGSAACSPAALATIVDLVGYGAANFFEGSAATPALSNTTAALRAGAGCTETDQNGTDFATGSPSPRNSASTPQSCGGGATLSIADLSFAEGSSGGTTTATFTVTVSGAHNQVTFDIATADGTGPSPSPAIVADGDYFARFEAGISLPAGPATATYSFAVTINSDVIVEQDEAFFVRVTNVTGATLADGEALGTIANDDEPPPVSADVAISQVYGGGGNTGATLTHDFIELFNRGTAAVNLANWSVQYSSAAGTGTWAVTPLSGSIAPGGYYLVQQSQGAGGTTALPTPDAIGTIGLAAGAGKVALQTTTTPIVGACPLGATADLVGYGAASCFEGTGATSALSNTTAALRKRGGCYDSNNNNVDFSAGNPTPRNSTATRSCTPVPAAIHDIQGSGLASPLAGLDVITSGIVTGVKSNGFFLQTPAVDANPTTSEALFVFTSVTPAVIAGTDVFVRGTVSEFFGLTQVEASLAGDITVTSTGNALPSAVILTTTILDPAGTPQQLEPYEGMRMHADSLTSVAPTDDFGEIATVLTGVARPVREPGIPAVDPVPPDPTSGVPDCCIPRFDGNPERIFVDTEGMVGATVLNVTSNVVLANVTGPLDFSFGAYKIVPETPPVAGANMSGVPVPLPAVDEFTVAGYNIENFDGSDTRRRKAALAIRQLMQSPDVIGHIEIVNLATLQALAQQVNDDAVAALLPDPGYQAVLIPTPVPGGTQNVGFLVKTSRVRIDSVTQELGTDTYINPISGQPETLHDRPPLVLRGTVDAFGLNPRPVIVVVNHLRSFIDIDLVTGDGTRVRAKRKAQAESTAGLLQQLQTDNPGVAVISVGDYNAYQFSDGYTDPIATLKGTPTPDDQIVVDESPAVVSPNFVNLTDTLPIAEQYSFIFEGTPQALDHVLVNTVAHSYVQRYAIARGNSDFPSDAALIGNATVPERSSDHDMPVAYFRFPPPSTDVSVVMTAEPTTATAGGQVTYTIVVTNNGPAPAQNVVVSDQLPSTLSFVSCSATGAGLCGATATSTTATFPLLSPGASETVTIVATVSCMAVNGSSIANIATVAADTADPDTGNNQAGAGVTASNATPTITGVSASRTQLLLPLYQMVPVTINYTASDTCGAVTTTLSVTSDEAVTGPLLKQGLAGLTSPDWQVLDAHRVRLRAERSFTGDGRVYTVTIRATDAAGGTSTQQITVTVPRWP